MKKIIQYFDQKKWLIPLLIFVISLTIRLIGINSQGQTWDEIAYYDAGKSYVSNVYHLDFNPSDWRATYESPPVAKWIYGIAGIPSYKNVDISDKFTFGRIASAIMGSLVVLLVYMFSLVLFKSKKTALVSALILAFLPHFIAHNKVEGLETPSALFYALTLFLFYLGLTKKSSYFIWTGLACGLALGTRFNNGHVIFAMLILALLFYSIKWNELNKSKFSYLILLIPIIGAALVYLLWPWLWGDFWNHVNQTRAFLETQLNGQKSGAVTDWFLNAKVVPPWYYYIYCFIATTPILILISLLIHLFKTIKQISFPKLFLWVWFLVPIISMSIVGFKQDGIRYIFPVLVPLAMISGCTVTDLFSKDKFNNIVSGIIIIYLLIISVLIYPYYLDYYSETVGGTKTVYEKRSFEIGWWGEGLEQGYRYLNNNANADQRVLVLVYPDYSNERIADHIQATVAKQVINKDVTDLNFDYIITNPAYYWYHPIPIVNLNDYQVAYEVKAMSAPIATVYKRK